MLIFACLLAVAAAAPATYDQRQDGDFNVRADVQNVVFLIAYPQKMNIPPNFFDGFLKNGKNNVHEIQERSDVRVLQAFVEPSAPYHVEIGSSDRSEGDGRAVEVVIAGRRRMEGETAEPEHEIDELKLVGAMEQCGPNRERDPLTLTCRDSSPQPEQPSSIPQEELSPQTSENAQPEVVPASS